MFRRFKKVSAAITLGVVVALTPVAAVTALSAPSDLMARSKLAQQACDGLNTIDRSENCDNQSGGGGVNALIKSVVNILSYIVGVIAVIFVIVAGLKYVTAAGDSNKLSSAKSTLIYALVGIAVVAFAQFLVNFVFNAAVEGF